ncbi:MAG: hypothetical protein LJE87_18285, partial [Deltaproteobacteria bacterium]|nr:hypothetical protein [Deltaproteobacteria bacterium]
RPSSAAGQVGACYLTFRTHTEKRKKLLAPSDCSEWLGRVVIIGPMSSYFMFFSANSLLPRKIGTSVNMTTNAAEKRSASTENSLSTIVATMIPATMNPKSMNIVS